jgi:hypothetical protein
MPDIAMQYRQFYMYVKWSDVRKQQVIVLYDFKGNKLRDNSVYFIAEAGVIIDDGTGTLIQPFSFNSASVFSPNSYKAQQQGAGTITPTISNNGTTYIATANFTISNAGLSGVPAGFFIIVQGTTADRTITYNTSATKTVHTNSGSTNAGQVIFYWLGDTFVAYN